MKGLDMNVARVLKWADTISTWAGKATAWLIVLLMAVICVEVFKRYFLNAPSSWIFDVSNIIYGTAFMLSGAYALAQDGHVRGDFFYANMKPRSQAAFDLVLYVLLFIPGILALIYAGYSYAGDSWRILEHSTTSSDGPPVYHFKSVIPLAGVLMMMQGLSEMLRCVVCLKTGEWPARLKDAEEIDVIEQQLANSAYVDTEDRKLAIERAHGIEEAAKQRGNHTQGQ
jgi:TRAP-type mannitol/chloroaromatic compound transport system permease small subunit